MYNKFVLHLNAVPVITLIFSLLGFAVIPFGPSLYISDFNLGILYFLAVSSISTYGILVAGYGSLIYDLWLTPYFVNSKVFLLYLNISSNNLYCLVFRCIILPSWFLALFFVLSDPSPLCLGEELELFWSCDVGETNIDQIQFMFGIVSFKSLKTINSYDSNSLKSLHSSFIKELYRGRKAPVIPFKEESVLATCYNILDKSIKSEFLKEWGLKSCIYLIAYKHDPLIYYIGRTNLFKRRLNNHLKAETNNKFHMFLNLVGWEHFNVSILEVCSLNNQGERENYYLQKYLPLLNSVFSSSIIESSIQITLKDKLNALRTPKSTLSSKKKSIYIYVYDIDDKSINKSYVLFKSMSEASVVLGINIASISQYKDTYIPYRHKLFFTDPIVDFHQAFETSNTNTPKGLVNRVIPVKIWS